MIHVNEQFNTILEIGNLSNEGLILFNIAEKQIVYINAVARKMIGPEQGSFSGNMKMILKLIVPEDREYLKNQYLEMRENSHTVEVEFRLRKPDDTIIWVCCNAYLISDQTCVVLFVRDISKAKQHENYLVEFGTKKNTLLDTIVHQVSGTLVLMQHLSASAERFIEGSHNQDLKTYFNLLNDNSKHCIQIINELLRDEHSKAPDISVKTSRIDVVDKVSMIYKNLREAYKDRKLSFNTSRPSIYFNTDEFKLLQIVNNFVSNAIKFTNDQKEISINIGENDQEVIISVSDNGIGIPDTLKPFLFQRQSLSGRTGLKGERSSGLGLYVSKKLAESMHGKIGCESEEGIGSTFFLALPKK